ncbi:hypothetical protein GCM10010176_024740 [Nonomuraea spiralis]|nr:hypothetical protein GCM10010176_024740 [Nonomuraea spiralis]
MFHVKQPERKARWRESPQRHASELKGLKGLIQEPAGVRTGSRRTKPGGRETARRSGEEEKRRGEHAWQSEAVDEEKGFT